MASFLARPGRETRPKNGCPSCPLDSQQMIWCGPKIDNKNTYQLHDQIIKRLNKQNNKKYKNFPWSRSITSHMRSTTIIWHFQQLHVVPVHQEGATHYKCPKCGRRCTLARHAQPIGRWKIQKPLPWISCGLFWLSEGIYIIYLYIII